jgi:uncharacterized protein (DUF111 family)
MRRMRKPLDDKLNGLSRLRETNIDICDDRIKSVLLQRRFESDVVDVIFTRASPETKVYYLIRYHHIFLL